MTFFQFRHVPAAAILNLKFRYSANAMFTVVHCMLQFAIPQYQHQPPSFDKFFSLKYFLNRSKNA
jgi:hypothetical protein